MDIDNLKSSKSFGSDKKNDIQHTVSVLGFASMLSLVAVIVVVGSPNITVPVPQYSATKNPNLNIDLQNMKFDLTQLQKGLDLKQNQPPTIQTDTGVPGQGS